MYVCKTCACNSGGTRVCVCMWVYIRVCAHACTTHACSPAVLAQVPRRKSSFSRPFGFYL